MDFATLLAPGSAQPIADPAMAFVVPSAAPGEAFSDVFAEAMIGATSLAPASQDAVLPGTSSDPLVPSVNEGFVAPMNVVPASVPPVAPKVAGPESPSAVDSTESSVPEAEPPAAESAGQPRSKTPRRLPPLETPPVETPPDPPPIPTRTSRKDAKTEAPNALAQRLDQPEKDAPPAIEKGVSLVTESVVPQSAPVVQTDVAPQAPSIASVPSDVKGAVVATPESITVPTVSRPKSPVTTKAVDEPAAKDLTKSTVTVRAAKKNPAPEVQAAVAASTDASAGVPSPAPKESAKLPFGPEVMDVPATKAAPVSILPPAPDLDIVPEVVHSPPTANLPTVDNRKTDLRPIENVPAPAMKAASEGKVVVTKESTNLLKVDGVAKPLGATTVETAEPADAQPVAKSDDSVAFDASALEATVSSEQSSADSGEEGAPQDNSPQAPATVVRTVATELPEAGVDRPAVDRHLVVRQVADRIENLVAARPRDGVTIHLEPRDLGTVTLVVKGLASALDVQMFASDERVRAGLETSRPELAQALAPRGIELRDVRVAPTSSSNGSAPRDGQSNPDERPRQQSPSPQQNFSSSHGRPATSSRPSVSRRGRGVDLLV